MDGTAPHRANAHAAAGPGYLVAFSSLLAPSHVEWTDILTDLSTTSNNQNSHQHSVLLQHAWGVVQFMNSTTIIARKCWIHLFDLLNITMLDVASMTQGATRHKQGLTEPFPVATLGESSLSSLSLSVLFVKPVHRNAPRPHLISKNLKQLRLPSMHGSPPTFLHKRGAGALKP